MIFRGFRRKASSEHASQSAWWREAERLAQDPTEAAIATLEQSVTSGAQAVDESERQQEMIEGLRQLAEIVFAPELPVVATQHRVIGADVCHFVAPAGLADHAGGGGKLFLTSRRLIYSSASVIAVPWHRVLILKRLERDLVVVGGTPDALALRCNVFGDALVAHHLAERLRKGRE